MHFAVLTAVLVHEGKLNWHLDCRALIDIQKPRAKSGFTKKRLRCARKAIPMFPLIVNTRGENERITGSIL